MIPDILSALGLSPRVRGNHEPPGARSLGLRSIPACAGEPVEHLCKVFPEWVYPRVCGGTLVRHLEPTTLWGLSPRVRGNPEQERF